MFDKVLIANRGAIAVRIIRTLHELGVKAVSVYAEADRDSLHVSLADEAYSLGEGAAADTYLNQAKLIEVAQQTGAQAVHPGYGFLSENPDFVTLCDEANITFLGPTQQQMEAFGLKHRAREIALENDVPLLPGSELLSELEDAVKAAAEVGYPVMLKSTAGGGGIGMQRCDSEQALRDAYESVRRLGESNFSNSSVFIEKFITQARHIEVQVFGDGQGNVLTLGERDCSAQRRNQKVVEETPAPNLPDAVREELQTVAARLMSAVNYRSAGTVEYVYDQSSNEFYFLEVNTRLQVEHGVTEMVYGVDIVRWMLELGSGEFNFPADKPTAHGHAIQSRVYAEDPNKNFQPSAGLLSFVEFPSMDGLRLDHWVETGLEVSPFFDPMLAKVICHAEDREQACALLDKALAKTMLYGIETNMAYVRQVLNSDVFVQGKITTRYLDQFSYQPSTIDVLAPGTQSMIQDYPARQGYWNVGVPPSGPFDSWSFRLGNRVLENDESCAGLEITLSGPTLRFNTDTRIALTGAPMKAELDGESIEFWQAIDVAAGSTLKLGKLTDAGSRSYLLVQGGLQCPEYLGSRSTFTLGQFGGHAGRVLRSGDVLQLPESAATTSSAQSVPSSLLPSINKHWEIKVIYGPHGAPDFFTPKDIATFFEAKWEVHYNSSRTGVRLIGPKPEWARTDGGEAGMHPSNIHDNAYAIGTIDFTGDMPVILGPDGPSLGGFVCPATVITAELWKLGQLRAGDRIKFVPVSIANAVEIEKQQKQSLIDFDANDVTQATDDVSQQALIEQGSMLKTIPVGEHAVGVTYRPSGDHYLLVEYGELKLDINLRFRAHVLMQWLEEKQFSGIRELTPGIRSLQIHYDSQILSVESLLELLEKAEKELKSIESIEVPARIVHIPLSWNDIACQEAVTKYMQSVRKDAPWCPDNIEFIRRINGLDSIDDVKRIVFDASYLVMGLGDVYLGAPVATPIDPRHRLVTTKYNPARTWTAENSVGIGGSYMCVYGMEGPGGYQFVGRTLQMWNRYHTTKEFEQPWLLRFFDQIKFYEVSSEELLQIRQDFPKGKYPLKIEETTFSLREYNDILEKDEDSISEFKAQRQAAFDAELQQWIDSGQINFESQASVQDENAEADVLADNQSAVDSPLACSIWKVMVEEGQAVKAGDTLMILEAMKMEITLEAPSDGVVYSIKKHAGIQVNAGDCLVILEETH
ncbi:urea carboxylase [Leucothrix sargassi]|nr:urea carboxylase [Leucothrix sargassi]